MILVSTNETNIVTLKFCITKRVQVIPPAIFISMLFPTNLILFIWISYLLMKIKMKLSVSIVTTSAFFYRTVFMSVCCSRVWKVLSYFITWHFHPASYNDTLYILSRTFTGLILCEEPYYNEAGYEKQRGTHEGNENSRMYNEMAVIKMLESIQNMFSRPSPIFKDEIEEHFRNRLPW